MPFNLVKYKYGWRVQDDEGNYYSKKPLTKTRARQQQKALYASESRKQFLSGKGYCIYIDENGDQQLILQGAGWFSTVIAKTKNIANKIATKFTSRNLQAVSDTLQTGIRVGYPPKVRNLLNKYGSGTVYKIILYREPIKQYINNILNVVTVGAWNKAKENMQYDDLFHLYLVAYLAMPNGDKVSIKIEKNEVITFTEHFSIPVQTEELEVPVPCCITLMEVMKKAEELVGPSFYLYDAFTNNCQMFIDNILKANNLNTPETTAFIKQDAVSILQQLPEYSGAFAKAITDIAAYTNRLVYGEGSFADEVIQSTLPKKKLKGGYYRFPDGTASPDPPAVAIYNWNLRHPDRPIVTEDTQRWNALTIQQKIQEYNNVAQKVINSGYKSLTPWEQYVYQQSPDINKSAEEARKLGLTEEQKQSEVVENKRLDTERVAKQDYNRYGSKGKLVVDIPNSPEFVRAERLRNGAWIFYSKDGSFQQLQGIDKWNWSAELLQTTAGAFTFKTDKERVDMLETIPDKIKEAYDKEWEQLSGADKFFSGLNDILIGVADIAEQVISFVPGVGALGDIITGIYDEFRPGTREDRMKQAIEQAIQKIIFDTRIGDEVAQFYLSHPEVKDIVVQNDENVAQLLTDVEHYGSLGEKFYETGTGFVPVSIELAKKVDYNLAGVNYDLLTKTQYGPDGKIYQMKPEATEEEIQAKEQQDILGTGKYKNEIDKIYHKSLSFIDEYFDDSPNYEILDSATKRLFLKYRDRMIKKEPFLISLLQTPGMKITKDKAKKYALQEYKNKLRTEFYKIIKEEYTEESAEYIKKEFDKVIGEDVIPSSDPTEVTEVEEPIKERVKNPTIIKESITVPLTDRPIYKQAQSIIGEDENPTAVGRGIGSVFKRQLKSIGLSPATYLKRVREKAEEEGYNPDTIDFADNNEDKLQIVMPGGKVVRFGAVGYGDYIIWKHQEAISQVNIGYPEQKRKVFHKSHSKIRGDWKNNKFSPNNLALKILW